MEGNIMFALSVMGGISLYLAIATLVGASVYSADRRRDEDSRIATAIICGALFPISVPIAILIYWIYSLINIPSNLAGGEKNSTPRERELEAEREIILNKVKELETKNKMSLEQNTNTNKPTFKVGDLITGVPGNPGNYKHLYEGCVCRVISVDGDNPMRVLLIDHIDSAAHKNYIGKEFKAPQRYFIKIESIKKTFKKKPKTKKKVAKRR